MGATTSFYPEFVANQILTNAQLNQLRDHLDHQDRLTRVRLIGTGIVCGLNWTLESDTSSISITEGYGVTSDGYVITLPATQFTHYRTYLDPREKDNGPRYGLWASLGKDVVKELLDETTAASMLSEEEDLGLELNAPELLTTLTPTDYVLVLYLEQDEEELNSCLVTACDNKGHNIRLNVRVLLILKADLEALEGCAPPPTTLNVPRLHVTQPLSTMNTAADINKGYLQIVQKHMPVLMEHVLLSVKTCATFLGLDQFALEKLPDLTKKFLEFSQNNDIHQYHYDELKDLGYAYNEFVTAACELKRDCCPDSEFPRHFFGGALDRSEQYRHEYQPASIGNVAQGELVHVRKLLLRVIAMMKNLLLKVPSKEVRITPSHTELYPLGKRALPFYYNLKSDLSAYWQPTKCCTTERFWSYANGGLEGGSAPTDVDFDYTQCSFLRIEGHLGMTHDDAQGAIITLQKKHNLEFEVKCLYLEDRMAEESQLTQGMLSIQASIEKALTQWRMSFAKLFQTQGEGGEEKILDELEKEIQLRRDQLFKQYQALVKVREAQPLFCDHTALVGDYWVARENFLNVLSHLRGLLPDLSSDTAKELSRSLVSGELVDQLQARLLSSLVWMKGQEQYLRDSHVPKTLSAFDGALFRTQYKALLHDLIEFYLVLNHLVSFLDSNLAGKLLPEVRSYLGRAKVDHVFGIHKILRDGAWSKVSNIFSTYESVRQQDPRVFKKFAEKFQGLEHLGGVEKGGTFILVSGQTLDGTGEHIVADFSLSGKVPCCCPIDTEAVCVPPVAQPNYFKVFFGDGEDGGILETFNVLDNDYDAYQTNQRKAQNETEARPHILLDQEKTELGGLVTILKDGHIQYENRQPIPGGVDRFSYTIERGDKVCPGKDRGQVLVLLVPRIISQPQPEPTPQVGIIQGRVFSDERGASAPGSIVRIRETGASTAADGKGNYAFVNLAPGNYTLQASLDNRTSPIAIVELSAGKTVSQDLTLGVIATSNIRGRVFGDTQGGAAPGSIVQIVGMRITTKADAKGAYSFPGLEPGKYSLQAVLDNRISAPVTVQLTLGDDLVVDLTLGPIIRTFPIPNNFTAGVAKNTDLPEEQVRIKATEIYGNRYQERVTVIEEAGADVAIQKTKTYELAKAFVVDALPDDALDEKTLLAQYQNAASTLSTTIKRTTNDENRIVYQELLKAVSQGLLDRLSVSDPVGISPASTEVITAMATILKDSGVNLTTFKKEMNIKQLETEFQLASPKGIQALLK